ncbi:MAG: M20/M25/M40 family metallo-hydrolase [Candidatus Heimdallarchaeaceae archaeon]
MSDDILEILEKLVSFQTVNNPVENQIPDREILDYIQEYLQPLGYTSVLYEKEGYWSIFSYIKRADPKVLFLGHCDVVPPGPDWETDPFKLVTKNNKAYGRGSSDMKSSVAIMLSLAKEFAEQGSSTIIFAFNLDEESGGSWGAGHLLEHLEKYDLKPDYVINGDASGLQIINRRRNPYVISLKLPKMIKEIKGKKETETFQTQIAGNRTMHAAYYDKTIDNHCADLASRKLEEKHYLVQSINGSFVKNNVIPSNITIDYIIPDESGNPLPYDENLTNFLYAVKNFVKVDIPSSPSDYGINLTFNYYAEKQDYHFIQLDLRIMSNDHEYIQKYFEDFFSNHNVVAEISAVGSIGPVDTPIDSPLVLKSIKIANELNLTSTPIEMGGATDSRWFSAANIPAIEFGSIGGNVHGSNEYVEIDSLAITREFYRQLYFSLDKKED